MKFEMWLYCKGIMCTHHHHHAFGVWTVHLLYLLCAGYDVHLELGVAEDPNPVQLMAKVSMPC